MSQGPPDNAGPPDDAGPPKHANARRKDDGTIEVGDNRLEELEEQINWDNLSPLEEWIVLKLRDQS